jgi:hypothetical protein
MATLTPSQLPSLREDGGLFRELDVLDRLRLGLPDGFEIFHEVQTKGTGVDFFFKSKGIGVELFWRKKSTLVLFLVIFAEELLLNYQSQGLNHRL